MNAATAESAVVQSLLTLAQPLVVTAFTASARNSQEMFERVSDIDSKRMLIRCLWHGAMLNARDSLHQFAVGANVTQGDRVGGG